MAKIIAVANHKGGVAKTTSCANIGAALAKKGYKTLLVDMDAQANLTSSFMDEGLVETSVYDAMKGAKLPIISIGENLELVPAHIDLAGADIVFSSKLAREQILKKLLARVSNDYSYILIDTPPSLGLLTINALTAAEGVIIPICAETLPLRGLVMLDEMIGDISSSINPDLHIEGIVITKYVRRKLDMTVIETLQSKYGDKVFKTYIRTCVAAAEAPTFHQSVLDYAPISTVAKDYEALAEEIINKAIKQ